MNLKEERKKLNITQEKIAYNLNISLRYYQKIEHGKALPNIITGLKICLILDLDPFLWLFN